MSDAAYLKCSCSRCGNHIEFPQEAAGATIDCPHCGQSTELHAERQSPARATAAPTRQAHATGPARRSDVLLAIGFGLVLLAAAAGGLLFLTHRHSAVTEAAAPAPAALQPAKPVQQVNPAQAPPAPPLAPAPSAPAPQSPSAKAGKSPQDFKIGPVKLDKTAGSSLVYVEGVLTNDSDFQRFGVRIKFDLLNAGGKGAGTAQDYKDVIEPHKTWQFRALVIGAKAASAKVESVTEEP
jgi:hypothetical protein